MANVLKKEPGDIGREEVICFLKNAIIRNRAGKDNEKSGYGWGGSNFNKKLKEFCESYELPFDSFSPDPDSKKPNIIIRSDWKDFALALMLTYNGDPYLLPKYDLADKASVDKILNYHEAIIEMVENHFSEDAKCSIMNTSHYQSMLDEHLAMNAAMEKMNELATAMGMSDSEVRGKIWKEIYLLADYLIYRTLEVKYNLHIDKMQLEEEQIEKFRKIAFDHLGEAMFSEINIENVNEKWQGLTAQMESSMEYYKFLIEKSAMDEDILLNKTCSNISQILAAKLRELLEHSKEAEDLQIDGDGKIYDVIQGVTKDIQQFEKARKVFEKECSAQEAMAMHLEEQKKIKERIEDIKKAYQKIETMEEITKKKIKDMEAGAGSDPSSYPLAFYEGVLEFYQIVKSKNEKNDKDRKSVFDEAILKGAYRFLEK